VKRGSKALQYINMRKKILELKFSHNFLCHIPLEAWVTNNAVVTVRHQSTITCPLNSLYHRRSGYPRLMTDGQRSVSCSSSRWQHSLFSWHTWVCSP